MRRPGLTIAACTALCACAQILGIDDGTPRTYADGSIVDASEETTTLPEAAPPVDAGIDVPFSALACGTSTCNAVTEGCCRQGDPIDAMAQSFACVSDASDCDGGLVVTCDDSLNCAALGHAGYECCATVPDGGSIATKTTCVVKGTCTGTLMCTPGDDELCNADAGQSCLPSIQTIVGWTICKT